LETGNKKQEVERMKHLLVFILVMVLYLPANSFAVQTSRPLPVDSRLRVMTYHPNGIHKYVGFYDYQASIVLEDGEEVKTISMGDTQAWQIVPSGNRIFIKPIADDPNDANTNMLLVTNKRLYHFILEAAEVGDDGIDDPELVFETRFVYPDSDEEAVLQLSQKSGPDLSEPEKYNFNYTISGSDLIAPIRVFDDAEFTYFQFTHRNAEVPAFFLVDGEGREALVNYRVNGDYIVLERVTSQLTLRYGQEVACVFNESRPLKKVSVKKKKGWF
jgi:type IV secretion system protein VirB9